MVRAFIAAWRYVSVEIAKGVSPSWKVMIFRDCSVHDFDVIRWVTGHDIVEVYARGSNNGDPAIGAVGDVDTALAVATLDDGTVTTVGASRYNGAGHDVRLEIQGSLGSVVVGLDGPAAARVLGKRPGAVRTAAYRGLKRLARQLGAEGVTDEPPRTLGEST